MTERVWLAMVDSVTKGATIIPVLETADLTLSDYGEGWVSLTWRPSARWLNAGSDKVIFGGAAASALEAAYGLALATVIEDDDRPAGVRVQTDYIRPVIVDTAYTVTGRVVERRRRTAFCHAEIVDSANQRVVMGSGVCNIGHNS